jgi:uncharacterized protein (DUF3820 family)
LSRSVEEVAGLGSDNMLVYLSHMDTPQPPFSDPDILSTLTKMKMPFGKYKGTLVCNLPVEYLEWFARKGFPPGKMGMLLATIYEIKLNGLEYLLQPLKKS